MSDKSRFVWSEGGPAHIWNSYQDMLDYDAANPDLDDGEVPVDPAPPLVPCGGDADTLTSVLSPSWWEPQRPGALRWSFAEGPPTTSPPPGIMASRGSRSGTDEIVAT